MNFERNWHERHARVQDLSRTRKNSGSTQFGSQFLGRFAPQHRLANEILNLLKQPETPSDVYLQLAHHRKIDRLDFEREWLYLADAGFVHLYENVIEKPLIIVSAPRAGSTLLFETLCLAPEFWNVGGESHDIIENLPSLRPENRNYDSHRLEVGDATHDVVALLHAGFVSLLRNRDKRRYLDFSYHERPTKLRLIEKTPRNALRVAFLNEVFPDAWFVFLHRGPEQNISSIMEAWITDGFWQFKRGIPYCELPGWDYDEWCMLLPPGWRDLNGKSIAEIAAFQWKSSNEFILSDLQAIPRDRWMSVSFDQLISNPLQSVKKISEFACVKTDDRIDEILTRPLRASSSVVSRPSAEKWRQNETAINQVMTHDLKKLSRQLDLMST